MKKRIKELKQWMVESYERRKMAQLWFRHYRVKRSIEFIERYNADALWQELETILRKKKRNLQLIYTSSAVAASLLLVLTFAYLISGKTGEGEKQPVLASAIEAFPETGGRKAILKLHTGEQIDLTNPPKQAIINEEDTLLLINVDKSLVYKQNANKTEDTKRYNTLTVPRGGEYQLVLSDGTKVWLNAESSLHYPVSFSKAREVELTGEAYFEVSRSNKPFLIHTGTDHKVEVLGTKFNVSAYEGSLTYTTLAEGKVKVYHANSSVTLLPNQQATAGKAGGIAVETVDATFYTSWAQGIFQFRKTKLSEITAQLSRWYDVNISFDDECLKHKLFTGVIFRHRELKFAVEAIEQISNVKFITENDIIYITKQKR